MMLLAVAAALTQMLGTPVVCPTDWRAAVIPVLGSADYAGYYVWDSRVIGLRPDVCGSIGVLMGGWKPRTQLEAAMVGFDLFILAHELAHSTGERDETAADCEAARTMVHVGETIGVDEMTATQLERWSRPYDGYQPDTLIGCWPTHDPSGFVGRWATVLVPV